MGNDISIIGGADGPTSVFLAGELGSGSVINKLYTLSHPVFFRDL